MRTYFLVAGTVLISNICKNSPLPTISIHIYSIICFNWHYSPGIRLYFCLYKCHYWLPGFLEWSFFRVHPTPLIVKTWNSADAFCVECKHTYRFYMQICWSVRCIIANYLCYLCLYSCYPLCGDLLEGVGIFRMVQADMALKWVVEAFSRGLYWLWVSFWRSLNLFGVLESLDLCQHYQCLKWKGEGFGIDLLHWFDLLLSLPTFCPPPIQKFPLPTSDQSID